MKRPIARPTATISDSEDSIRLPRAFLPTKVEITETDFDPTADEALVAPAPKPMGWVGRAAWTAGGILVSAGISLAADRLIRDLFAANEWLGWAGIGVLAIFVLAVIVLAAREVFALRRLRVLDSLKRDATLATSNNDHHAAQQVAARLETIYAGRADLARARQSVTDHLPHMFDGSEIVALAERTLMAPLDARAKALTAASARRVALVTAVSPRALVDIAFVVYESIRLAGAIAALYGARPGFFGFWRLTGAILAHLAVTGGLVLTDGIVEQLVGQGIAAMRVVRPLPFQTQQQPMVRDFIPELTKLTGDAAK